MVSPFLASPFVAGWFVWDSILVGSSINDSAEILVLDILDLGVPIPLAGTCVLPLTRNGYDRFVGFRSKKFPT